MAAHPRLHVTDASLAGSRDGSLALPLDPGLQVWGAPGAGVTVADSRAFGPAAAAARSPRRSAVPIARLPCYGAPAAGFAAAAAALRLHSPTCHFCSSFAGGGCRPRAEAGRLRAARTPVRMAGPRDHRLASIAHLDPVVRASAPGRHLPSHGALCAAVHAAGGGCWQLTVGQVGSCAALDGRGNATHQSYAVRVGPLAWTASHIITCCIPPLPSAASLPCKGE